MTQFLYFLLQTRYIEEESVYALRIYALRIYALRIYPHIKYVPNHDGSWGGEWRDTLSNHLYTNEHK